MKVTAIILAGGKNLRLGKNKALETIGGKIIIERVIERLRPLASQILVVTATKSNHLPGAAAVEFLTDLYPAYGPLGGIYSGMVTARSSHSLVVACDMPFLNTSLLGYMIEQAADFDAVVPRLDGNMMEPLHAVYSASCLEKIKERLERKQLSVNQFVRTLRVRYIEKAEAQHFDPELLSFFNINYPDDLERAKAIAVREETTRKTGY